MYRIQKSDIYDSSLAAKHTGSDASVLEILGIGTAGSTENQFAVRNR